MSPRFRISKSFDPDPKEQDERLIEVVEVGRDELETLSMHTWAHVRELVRPEQLKTVRSSKQRIDRVPDGRAWMREGRGMFAGRPVLYQQGW